MDDRFMTEMDEAQDQCYDEFRTLLGLAHTEKTWDAFVLAWGAGKDWGHQMEYSYPS